MSAKSRQGQGPCWQMISLLLPRIDDLVALCCFLTLCFPNQADQDRIEGPVAIACGPSSCKATASLSARLIMSSRPRDHTLIHKNGGSAPDLDDQGTGRTGLNNRFTHAVERCVHLHHISYRSLLSESASPV